MNKVIAHGNFTRDPEIKNKNSKTKRFTVFGFAVNVDSDHVVFYNCSAFGKKGDFIADFFEKGKEAILEGVLTTNIYEDKGGIEHTSLNLAITDIHFCGKNN